MQDIDNLLKKAIFLS